MFTNTVILVTGGTGSWGIELVRQLLTHNPKKIIILSRNENSQVQMRRDIKDKRLSFFIGDIRDKEALGKAFLGVDFVFHLAALKHVPVCEENPLEALKTNVIGTQNVIEASIENHVKKVIYVSTDKAANPVNSYGMTKALGERLIIHANESSTVTKFLCVRGGNVLGSSGSVLPLFKKQIIEQKQVQITDKRMTRYFITPQKAIKTLLKATILGKGGEIFVMHMDACNILDLAQVLIDHYGKGEIKIVEIGVRRGEKIHEVLIGSLEKDSAVVYDEDLIVIFPDSTNQEKSQLPVGLTTIKSGLERPLMTKDEIRELLVEGGLL
ncbi:polysaccharide biosynthesis protein [Filibacter tadaridae]|uniref:UDP-N-acetylglucosamine 4,6-dehydratase (Inverting) n=1 Tax=Filibacter tadaridae TaxID=2483811 RepID=A0A3P5XDG4_9BACL|nr:polysaccharide biosynthesis protein [Filibacter tadaridae]VDC28891.1 UDP-N-acetylglucosamine 4,6-dehydratase (inverting) [Filibacter tadaridae]